MICWLHSWLCFSVYRRNGRFVCCLLLDLFVVLLRSPLLSGRFPNQVAWLLGGKPWRHCAWWWRLKLHLSHKRTALTDSVVSVEQLEVTSGSGSLNFCSVSSTLEDDLFEFLIFREESSYAHTLSSDPATFIIPEANLPSAHSRNLSFFDPAMNILNHFSVKNLSKQARSGSMYPLIP